MKVLLIVGMGSFFGGIFRFWISGLVANRIGETFPWGTLTVNIAGSLIIGLVGALADTEHVLVTPAVRQLIMVGFCGGFTTFSSFSLQTMKLLQDGEWFYFWGNVVLSVTACLAAVFIGYKIGQFAN